MHHIKKEWDLKVQVALIMNLQNLSYCSLSNFGTEHLPRNPNQCFSSHKGPEKILKDETVMVLAGLELIFCMVAGM